MAVIIDEVTAEGAPPPPQPAEPVEIETGPLDPLPILALWRRETERHERLWVD
jgi:hypothetical protein